MLCYILVLQAHNIQILATLTVHLQVVIFVCSKLINMATNLYTHFLSLSSPCNELCLKHIAYFSKVDYVGVLTGGMQFGQLFPCRRVLFSRT